MYIIYPVFLDDFIFTGKVCSEGHGIQRHEGREQRVRCVR